MFVRADTLKADPVLHQEVFALFIAKLLELLTVVHSMGLHFEIEAVCAGVRWSCLLGSLSLGILCVRASPHYHQLEVMWMSKQHSKIGYNQIGDPNAFFDQGF